MLFTECACKRLNSIGMFKVLMILLSVIFLAACSSSPRYNDSSSVQKSEHSSLHSNRSSVIYRLLLKQYRHWKGTPYRYGGTSLSGVDCSAFVQNTYRSKLGKQIPRTTRTQIKIGKKVKKSQLKVGDIVFFKTGRTSLHNGIYLGNAQFMHASSSKGVTISSLNNRYWRKRYLTSRRIL